MRLRHDLKGYLRSLVMTRVQALLYIEGTDNDPVFYEAIRTRYASDTGYNAQIRLANELPNAAERGKGGSGGKDALLRAARFLERWRGTGPGRLLPDKKIAFCVDKDVDDFEAKLKSSCGVVYTPLHSTENHIVLGSDLHKAICCAISAPAETVKTEIGDCSKLRLLANNWREWVIYCLLSRRLNLKNTGNYAQESPFNKPPHNPVDRTLASTKLQEAKAACGRAPHEFDAELSLVTLYVDQLIHEDRFDEAFKGKWYVSIFYSLIECNASLGSRCRGCGKNGLWIGIRSAFTLDESVYRHYADAFALL